VGPFPVFENIFEVSTAGIALKPGSNSQQVMQFQALPAMKE
jgi:hypothetical protein